jgi:Tfp pilus assembly protein PilX
MTRRHGKLGARHPEQGAVLVVVLLVMMTLLGLGVMTLWLTSANLQVGSTVNMRTQALYVAEAGLERARGILNAQSAPIVNTMLTGSTAPHDDVPTGVDAATGYPNGVGAILREGATPLRNVTFPPNSFLRTGGTAESPISAVMGTYTVWIRNDQADVRKGNYTADVTPGVVIRSRGVASDGRTNVVLEVTMLPTSLLAATAGGAGGGLGDDCVAGKNACDDNSSTQYGISFDAP